MSAELKSLVPGAMESERAALGAVLVDEKHMPTLLALVRVEDFFQLPSRNSTDEYLPAKSPEGSGPCDGH